MNKKLLLLGAAFALTGINNADARISGFYVGLQGGMNMNHFKIFDGTSHKGTDVSHTFGAAASYGGINLNNYKQTIAMPDMVIENEDFEATSEYQYKVRPSGSVFVGYNYQIGSNFVVGLELSGGAVFGEHKFVGHGKTPNLKHFSVSATNTLVEKTPFAESLEHSFEVKTKFFGDASIRLGYVLPGTDGRLVLFARGGAGLTNREITSSLKDSQRFYSEGMFDGFYRSASTIVKANMVGGATPAQQAEFASAMAMSDPCYFAYKLESMGLNGYSKTYTATTNADLAVELIQDVLLNGDSSDKLLAGLYAIDADLSAEETKTKWSWHAGADLEYHWANGAFVRASYTFKYLKGFFAEKSVDVSTPDKTKLIAAFKTQIDNGALDILVSNAKLQGGGANAITPANLYAAVDSEFAGIPDGKLNIGKLNYKVGTGDKSYSHDFSVGIGYKFFG